MLRCKIHFNGFRGLIKEENQHHCTVVSIVGRLVGVLLLESEVGFSQLSLICDDNRNRLLLSLFPYSMSKSFAMKLSCCGFYSKVGIGRQEERILMTIRT